MNLLNGIQLYELVLMILGFILGLVLIFVFLYLSLQGRTNLKLLYGFIAPIVMIGYPSIQSISFSKDVIKIDKLVQKVNANPSDTLAQQALIQEIQTLPKSRCITSTDAMTTIADAQSALGLYDSAQVTINKAIKLDPSSNKAIQSHKEIEQKWHIQKDFEQRVEVLKLNMEALGKKPTDNKLRDSIARRLKDLQAIDAPVRVHQAQAVLVAKAAAIVGEKLAAEQITNAVLSANPKFEEAQNLKKQIKNKEIEKKYGTVRAKVSVKVAPAPVPNERQQQPQAPKVAAPAPVQTDVSKMLFRLIPRGAENFVKWDKEN